jgi:[protein-PII] uridylyltransferase
VLCERRGYVDDGNVTAATDPYSRQVEFDHAPLLADRSVTGGAWARRHSDLVDEWLRATFAERLADFGADELALVAVGGFGRAELCPQSDLDLALVHRGHPEIAEIAQQLWYPIWDAGFKLGHNVGTVVELVTLASGDLDTATAFLSARLVAGDGALARDLAMRAHERWQKLAKRRVPELAARVSERHANVDDVAFTLEPDLKEGRGGLRDVHSLQWLEAAHPSLRAGDTDELAEAYDTLLTVRVELQRHTGRASNVLALQDQDVIADALGEHDADELMARVATAARTIAWIGDDVWHRVRHPDRPRLGGRAPKARALGPGITVRSGRVHADPDKLPRNDPALALRVANLAIEQAATIDRDALAALAEVSVAPRAPWPVEMRELFISLLLTGRPAIGALEALDRCGAFTALLPEWSTVRCKPQRNAYHRYTVDRHLLEAAANAARFSGRVGRPDLLVLAALLHDIGKGATGDHIAVGVPLARTIVARMGYPDADCDTVARLVEHHLLLSEIATRRDIDDPATLRHVAALVGDIDTLSLLAALTEADSLATGPTAWGPAKARLVSVLVERTDRMLRSGEVDGADGAALGIAPFPTEEQLGALGAPGTHIEGSASTLTVMTDDRPGVFSRIAGVLALHGLDVTAADAHSTETGRALSVFAVDDPFGDGPNWPRVHDDLTRALDEGLALRARVAERARRYERRARAVPDTRTTVAFDNDVSDTATVIDVQTIDGVGVLFRVTAALAEFDLDIRAARVNTMGTHVLDAFYVRDRAGRKLRTPETLDEIARAVRDSLETRTT